MNVRMPEEWKRSNLEWPSNRLLFYFCSFLYSFHLWKVKVLATQSCLTLCDPKDYSLLGSSVHGILQTRILEWVTIPFSGRSSWPKDWTLGSCIAGRLFTIWVTREAHFHLYKAPLSHQELLEGCFLLKKHLDFFFSWVSDQWLKVFAKHPQGAL